MRSVASSSVTSQSIIGITGATDATRLRPHCSDADTAIACQCRRRDSARSPARRSTLRDIASGTIAAAPSSTDFSTVQSMRSPDERPCATMKGQSSSASRSSKRTTWTSACGSRATTSCA